MIAKSYFLFLGFCLAQALCALPATAATGACIDDICFQERVAGNAGDAELRLRGIGEAKWWGFALYAAALYVDPLLSDPQKVLQPFAKRLTIEYRRSISAKHIVAAAERHLRAQNDSFFAEYESAIAALHKAYEDVSAGDRYELEYKPGEGTALFFNGQEKVRIATDDAFAALYFGIWLSEDAVHAPLRNALLNWERGS